MSWRTGCIKNLPESKLSAHKIQKIMHFSFRAINNSGEHRSAYKILFLAKISQSERLI